MIHAHNAYFELLADTGFPGVIVLLALTWQLLCGVWQARPEPVGPADGHWIWWGACFTGVVGRLLHSQVDVFYWNPVFLPFAIIVGVTLRRFDHDRRPAPATGPSSTAQHDPGITSESTGPPPAAARRH